MALRVPVAASRLFAGSFYVDLRSLAAMRFALGLVIIADLATRGAHLVAHYTDLGAMPSDLLVEEYGASVYLSLHYWLGGSPAAVAALFVANGIAALLLAAGVRTRVMTVICWYLLASMTTRSPLLQTAGDRTLQLLLFWSVFLPLGARWAADAARRGQQPAANRHVSIAGFALLAQVAIIYLMTAVLKLQVPMWRDGGGVEHSLKVDVWVTALGIEFRGYEGVLPLLTLLVLFWELVGPLLAFIPGFTTPGRLTAIAGFWLMHLGFGLCFDLGVFPFMSAAAWLAFLPGPFWDRVAPWSAAAAPAAVSRLGAWANVAAACALAFVCVLNLRALHPKMRSLIPGAVERAGAALRLRQAWGMFTSETALLGWYLVHGELENGEVVDLMAGGGPATRERPEVVSELYPSVRWKHFLYGVRDLREHPFWASYAEYLCRTWNAAHERPRRCARVTITFMLRQVDMFGQETITPVPLHDQQCPQ